MKNWVIKNKKAYQWDYQGSQLSVSLELLVIRTVK